jgi:hypothetical protein
LVKKRRNLELVIRRKSKRRSTAEAAGAQRRRRAAEPELKTGSPQSALNKGENQHLNHTFALLSAGSGARRETQGHEGKARKSFAAWQEF